MSVARVLVVYISKREKKMYSFMKHPLNNIMSRRGH